MLAVGLVLIGLGVLVVVLGVATIDDAGDVSSMLGFDLGTTTIFLVGVGSGLAIIAGLWLCKVGTQQGLRRRRRAKQAEKSPRQENPPPSPPTDLKEIDPGAR